MLSASPMTLPKKRVLVIAAAVLLPSHAFISLAQNTATTESKKPNATTETVVVLGSPAPVPLAESPASVLVLPVGGESLKVESFQDLLRKDSSIEIEERGAGGGQADLILRGGTFEQALVLLNGFRINDSQTSHHNLDLPIPLGAIDSMEVLHGAGSTLHGTDALSGVADFLTAAPTETSLYLKAGGGSFGENEESLLGSLVRKQWSSRLAAERNFSTGFMTDRDYRNEDAMFESWANSWLGVTDLLFAASDRSFGANQFYGPYDSWERTKGWFASARQELESHTVAAFGYRRHTDEFILLRNDPSVYENNHIDDSWQASLRRTVPLASPSVLLLGLESDGDSIDSNNLGLHARNRGAGYIDMDLRPAKRRWNLSAGMREEIFSGGAEAIFAPHLAGSYRLTENLKLRASGGYGYRIPTYTDLYYSDPTTIGNPNLKPESAWSGEAGADLSVTSKLVVAATGFYSRQHDSIDYVREAAPNNPLLPAQCNVVNRWCAVNLNGLRFAGVESTATWLPRKGQSVQIAWTALVGAQPALTGLQSEYALNYPTQNLHASWSAVLSRWATITNSVQLLKKYQQSGEILWNPNAYPVWSVAVTHDHGRIRPYLRAENLSNTGYQEIDGVAMPGRSIVGGISLELKR